MGDEARFRLLGAERLAPGKLVGHLISHRRATWSDCIFGSRPSRSGSYLKIPTPVPALSSPLLGFYRGALSGSRS